MAYDERLGRGLFHLLAEAQALELRLLVDEILARDPERLVAAAGDFNAEDHESPLRLVVAGEDDTGNTGLAPRSLVVLDRALPADRRWSLLHGGRREMLDHVLASGALHRRFRRIEVLNEGLADEAVAAAGTRALATSYHAPIVAEFGWN